MVDSLSIFGAGTLPFILAATAVLYFLYAPVRKKVTLCVLGITTLPLSFLFGKIAGMLFVTQRPFVTLDMQPLVEHVADNGFPSEHTLYALIIAGVVWSVQKKLGAILIISGLLIGTARVFTLVHNPIDILGSALIALIVFKLITLRPIQKKIKQIETTIFTHIQNHLHKS